MGQVKIELTIGGISFSGEGGQEWIAAQLDKILEKAPELMQSSFAESSSSAEEAAPQKDGAVEPDETIAQTPLPKFLEQRNATKPQVRKFLATAVWLEAKGTKRPSTRDVTRALKDSSQSRLSNAGDCLNKNVRKGYCEKDGQGFFVTQEGKDSL